ncbi:MAG: glycoside hydrolase [Candidatus Eremiobacteraeota bacterium]|nr:glycoside hydrolase [Candidatus Eremiobacteraeota bacterium]
MLRRLLSLALALSLAACGGSGATPPVGAPSVPPIVTNMQRISTDPFTNGSSQHQTEVEPSMLAMGSTVVAAFQAGRFFQAGASDIGFATSRDAGATWTAGFLPGITTAAQAGNPFASVSDPAVAFDAKHNVWLIASLPILPSGAGGGVLVSRSTDAINWSSPIGIDPSDAASDKDWVVCDNSTLSPFFGRCYLEWDEGGTNGAILMSTSGDGGATWSAPISPSGNPAGIGGQQVVQPNGAVIVPIDDFNEATVLAFRSSDGGAHWSNAVVVSPITARFEPGGLRSGPLPSAAIDGSGRVYVVWEDCSFRPACATNDLVLSTSNDGIGWTPPARVPIDATTSGVDHFIPGIAVDPATSGGSARIALSYYFYTTGSCGGAAQPPCQLYAGFIGSHDGGSTWGAPVQLAGPMQLSWLPQTFLGRMVGDYIASTFAAGQPLGIFAVANANPSGATFDEAIYVPRAGTLTVRLSGERRSAASDQRIPGARAALPQRPRPHRLP